MIVTSFIEELDVINVILLHLDLWVVRNHDPPVGKIVMSYIPDKIEICEVIQFTEKMQFYNDSGDCDRPYEDDYSQVTEYAE